MEFCDKQSIEKPIIENLKVTAISDSQITQNDKVKIEISYDVTKDIDTFVAVTLWDIVRGQSVVNSNSKKSMSTGKGHHKINFEIELSSLNDLNIRTYVSIRDEDGAILAYNLDEQSPTFILRRSDYPNPNEKTTDAVLFNRGRFIINEKNNSTK